MNTNNFNQNANNEQNKLYYFMKKYQNLLKTKNNNSPKWTHCMTYEPYGSYNIPDETYNEFIDLYADAISAGHKLHIREKHKDFGPIVIDFDFIQQKNFNHRYYTSETVRNIIKTYNSIINTYLHVKENFMEAYVLEKEKPTMRMNYVHDGIHIIYPHICTVASVQMSMRDEFIKYAEENGIFKHIPLKNSLHDVFDKSIMHHNGFMMYGSTKNMSSYCYNVTCIYRVVDNNLVCEIPNDTNMSKKENVLYYTNLLSCRRFKSINDLTVLKEIQTNS
ncbi:helicase III/ VV D5-type ATPase N-terminus [Tupanvirus soda lake]|uniref:Helicase III/ VV D5-type ATPase N-terminus n=2 Tax=Tupanvirus TaxID=2094720 RepID=A0A6N1NNU1_9VIRU|nr:helicase III/ VV D5-type ATPase N-terminus [Tupanvirus soda lake]QKU35600.1 helicase III/ VV D5-type ATPase N-terminus [Tupanvirus soda lake]